MGTTQIIAIVVFVVVMVAIVTEKIHRALAAVVGAMVLLILHVSASTRLWSTSTSTRSACF